MDTVSMTVAEKAAVARAPRVQERMREEQRAADAQARKTAAKDLVREAAERMADDMMEIEAVSGCCQDRDLIGRGWTPAALAAHGDEANRIALARAGNGR